MSRMLTREEARAFYDRFGARQDRQGWYEDAALEALARELRLGEARRVYELGCGTGRLAQRLLSGALPPDAEYVAVDLSATMRALAAERLRPFAPRAAVYDPEALPRELLAPGRYDRYLSAYVFDLLSETETGARLEEAHRLLAPGGVLGIAGLTPGETAWGRAVMGLWRAVHARHPRAVGGCRPLRVAALLRGDRWRVLHRGVHSAYGICSEVVVAARVNEAEPSALP